MTGEDQGRRAHDRGGDVAAYALGALDPAELDEFRAHLESCVVCADELAGFQRIADVLPMAAPQVAAPKSLRRRVVRSVRAERASAEPSDRAGRRWTPGRWSALGRPGLAIGGLAAALVIAFAAIEIFSGSSSSSPRVVQASVIGSPGRAQLHLFDGQAQLVVRRIASPPAGEIYEVWLKRANRNPMPTSALFGVTDNGNGDVDVPGNLSGVQQVLVTREPAGGSATPTHSPVIVAQLS
jgi:anti-sigma-K factor RskA